MEWNTEKKRLDKKKRLPKNENWKLHNRKDRFFSRIYIPLRIPRKIIYSFVIVNGKHEYNSMSFVEYSKRKFKKKIISGRFSSGFL